MTQERRLWTFGDGRDGSNVVRSTLDLHVESRRPKGRPKNCISVGEDMRKKKVSEGDTRDTNEWKQKFRNSYPRRIIIIRRR